MLYIFKKQYANHRKGQKVDFSEKDARLLIAKGFLRPLSLEDYANNSSEFLLKQEETETEFFSTKKPNRRKKKIKNE